MSAQAPATPAFMVIPSLACQASCTYCFGPHKGPAMDERTAKETVAFIRAIAAEASARELSITFHGGEPLLAPLAVWKTLFAEIKAQLSAYQVRLNVQSNLWNLDEAFLELFRRNDVAIGTSLDGPRELCDLNRGQGYFDCTQASIQKAAASGCQVSAIATITRQTLPHVREIAKYFRDSGMSLVLHGAVAGMEAKASPFALTASEYAGMITELFPWYVRNRTHMRIETLDHFARGIVTGNPGVCTLRDCFGMFLSIAPTGDVTSCQRLAGKTDFRLGNIFDKPTLAELYASPAAQKQRQREAETAERCTGCEWYSICKGGCYYSALVSGNGVIDPQCDAYKSIYAFVQDQIMTEMQTPENLEAVAERPAEPGEHPLLRQGAYISLSGKAHPSRIADNARRLLSIHELSKTGDPRTAARNLYEQKICGQPELTEKLLEDMRRGLSSPQRQRNNCYVHVTFNCNLRCGHCYAESGYSVDKMRPENFERLLREAIQAKFRQVVITGGEPLVHSRRDELLRICEACKGTGANLVLRTNLTGDFAESDFEALARAFDQVVVSVDGDEDTHDARRGQGAYANVTYNLAKYARLAAAIPSAAELSLACVLGADEINGGPGCSVRALAERLQVERVRFRPLLPLGRAARLTEPVICEGLMQHVRPENMLKGEIRPLTTCGIGHNLYVTPTGESYPCYAWRGEHTRIGNVFENGLGAVLETPAFLRLTECTVDTIAKCRDCEYRYLCGGACRAWGNQHERDLNAAPPECGHLRERARKLVKAARQYLV